MFSLQALSRFHQCVRPSLVLTTLMLFVLCAQAQTRGDGSYTFVGVPVGRVYSVAPARRRYTFMPGIQSLTLTGDVTGINFVANRP